MSRTSGESSTRWKSSRIRTAPCSAMRGQLAQEDVDRRVAGRPAHGHVAQHRRRGRREPWIVLAAGGDEVVQERDPVAIVVLEPVPQGPKAGPPREVGEQRRLAVARIGEDEDHAVVDLRAQPVQQPIAGERLVAQRRRLDLRELDRVAVQGVARGSVR